jgi:hypothetical protein
MDKFIDIATKLRDERTDAESKRGGDLKEKSSAVADHHEESPQNE